MFDQTSRPPVRTALPGSPGGADRCGGGEGGDPLGGRTACHHPRCGGWQPAAVSWLLDLCPPDYRGHAVLRRHPAALAWLADLHVAAQVDAMRQAYRTVRVDLAESLPDGTIDALLVALEHEGLRLRSAQRSILLIREALDGSVFVDRL
ncbi:hypothetical protein B277_04277 [Janibacter hoylei PVAS-1]|uniref:Uncharacterized protein n=1 Tax=Janibacter hoylei PVAS-1 TaxID=1210046 RepID=K1E052_9MICO|nr:hypothetical protein [Janibacter hoylei]EKA62054.1 hypothetical protein B277_04277 [Janibacter hoylei PVAS-1]